MSRGGDVRDATFEDAAARGSGRRWHWWRRWRSSWRWIDFSRLADEVILLLIFRTPRRCRERALGCRQMLDLSTQKRWEVAPRAVLGFG